MIRQMIKYLKLGIDILMTIVVDLENQLKV